MPPHGVSQRKRESGAAMESREMKTYYVFMNYDPEYERLRADRTKKGASELDRYLSRKHDEVLARNLEAGSFEKTLSLVIVDGFCVQTTEEQATLLRSAKEVRLVDNNQELI